MKEILTHKQTDTQIHRYTDRQSVFLYRWINKIQPIGKSLFGYSVGPNEPLPAVYMRAKNDLLGKIRVMLRVRGLMPVG